MPQLFWVFNKTEYDLFKMIVFYRAFPEPGLCAALRQELALKEVLFLDSTGWGGSQASAELMLSGPWPPNSVLSDGFTKLRLKNLKGFFFLITVSPSGIGSNDSSEILLEVPAQAKSF